MNFYIEVEETHNDYHPYGPLFHSSCEMLPDVVGWGSTPEKAYEDWFLHATARGITKPNGAITIH